LGSWRIAVARGCRTGADHKFLIVPQCTLSAGISLCDICAKSEQLPAIPPVFTALPQLRRIAGHQRRRLACHDESNRNGAFHD
jgi:hypothetical protein